MKAFITALTIIMTACVLTGCATEYHVSTTGLDSNPGTRPKPFKTISRAAEVAGPGVVITVHEGVYRERINPPRGGESDDKRIVYQAAPGEKVVIKGSEIIKSWQHKKRPAVMCFKAPYIESSMKPGLGWVSESTKESDI